MTWSVSSCFITLVVLFLWRVEDIAEACKCAPVHLQQAFCSADVVIRAKVVGVTVGSNTKYDIQQIKMFKGPHRVIHAIFTSSSSASCGVTLETNKEYLITGAVLTTLPKFHCQHCVLGCIGMSTCSRVVSGSRISFPSANLNCSWGNKGQLNTAGRMHIIMCNFIQYWEDLSGTQKKSLTRRYQSGCDCTIIRCSSLPCPVSTPDECLWTDWLLEDGQSGPQAKNFACLKRSDGSCTWYRGMAPSNK